ncbi:hypothetical protein F4703DRAFT_1797825 [Phycomyces blakesleeanus]
MCTFYIFFHAFTLPINLRDLLAYQKYLLTILKAPTKQISYLEFIVDWEKMNGTISFRVFTEHVEQQLIKRTTEKKITLETSNKKIKNSLNKSRVYYIYESKQGSFKLSMQTKEKIKSRELMRDTTLYMKGTCKRRMDMRISFENVKKVFLKRSQQEYCHWDNISHKHKHRKYNFVQDPLINFFVTIFSHTLIHPTFLTRNGLVFGNLGFLTTFVWFGVILFGGGLSTYLSACLPNHLYSNRKTAS